MISWVMGGLLSPVHAGSHERRLPFRGPSIDALSDLHSAALAYELQQVPIALLCTTGYCQPSCESFLDSEQGKESHFRRGGVRHVGALPAAAIRAFLTPKVFSQAAGLAVMICKMTTLEHLSMTPEHAKVQEKPGLY